MSLRVIVFISDDTPTINASQVVIFQNIISSQLTQYVSGDVNVKSYRIVIPSPDHG